MEYFKNKKNTTNVAILIVAILVSFYAGTMYSKSQTPSRGQFPSTNGGAGQFSGAGSVRGTTGVRGGGGMTAGEIIAKDDTSITVKTQDGSTKIVLIGSSTQIAKSIIGNETDFVVGINVTVVGSLNMDGSVTAQSVQIRPLSQSIQK